MKNNKSTTKEVTSEEKDNTAKAIAIVSAAVCAFLAVYYLISFTVVPVVNYRKATSLMNTGRLDKAYNLFKELGDYKDSAEKVCILRATIAKQTLKNAEAGDSVVFGLYEQDNDISNGKEEIEWLVLAVEDERALLVSKFCLDCMKFESKGRGVTWEECTIRQWLNNEFMEAAFSTYERDVIPAVTVPADKNPDYKNDPSKATQDQVFLLSVTEVDKYLTHITAKGKYTAYAIANGARKGAGRNTWWWLRTIGQNSNFTVYVTERGLMTLNGCFNDSMDIAVRPALWIDFGE